MEVTEKKQKDAGEDFIKEADNAKLSLIALEKEIKNKQDYHSRTLEKVRIKCQGQFETQR